MPRKQNGDEQLLTDVREASHFGENGDAKLLLANGHTRHGHKFNVRRTSLPETRLQLCLQEARSLRFWRAVFAEFFGTMFLVLVAVGSTIQKWRPGELDVVQIALTFGLCVATIIWIIGYISGAHINPAVTMAMLITRRMSLVKAVIYITAQCFGAVAGALILKIVTPANQRGELGATMLSDSVTPTQGLAIEFCISMILVLTIFASCDKHRNDQGAKTPLTIGLSVSVGHLWAVEFSGASMNPARSFGPAVIMGIWIHHWVYWVGPILGGVTAGLLYDIILAGNASFGKFRKFITAADFDGVKYEDNEIVHHPPQKKNIQLSTLRRYRDGSSASPVFLPKHYKQSHYTGLPPGKLRETDSSEAATYRCLSENSSGTFLSTDLSRENSSSSLLTPPETSIEYSPGSNFLTDSLRENFSSNFSPQSVSFSELTPSESLQENSTSAFLIPSEIATEISAPEPLLHPQSLRENFSSDFLATSASLPETSASYATSHPPLTENSTCPLLPQESDREISLSEHRLPSQSFIETFSTEFLPTSVPDTGFSSSEHVIQPPSLRENFSTNFLPTSSFGETSLSYLTSAASLIENPTSVPLLQPESATEISSSNHLLQPQSLKESFSTNFLPTSESLTETFSTEFLPTSVPDTGFSFSEHVFQPPSLRENFSTNFLPTSSFGETSLSYLTSAASLIENPTSVPVLQPESATEISSSDHLLQPQSLIESFSTNFLPTSESLTEAFPSREALMESSTSALLVPESAKEISSTEHHREPQSIQENSSPSFPFASESFEENSSTVRLHPPDSYSEKSSSDLIHPPASLQETPSSNFLPPRSLIESSSFDLLLAPESLGQDNFAFRDAGFTE